VCATGEARIYNKRNIAIILVKPIKKNKIKNSKKQKIKKTKEK
jgi:hypothetical protein